MLQVRHCFVDVAAIHSSNLRCCSDVPGHHVPNDRLFPRQAGLLVKYKKVLGCPVGIVAGHESRTDSASTRRFQKEQALRTNPAIQRIEIRNARIERPLFAEQMHEFSKWSNVSASQSSVARSPFLGVAQRLRPVEKPVHCSIVNK